MVVLILNFAVINEIFTLITARYSFALRTSTLCMPGTQRLITSGSNSSGQTSAGAAGKVMLLSRFTHHLRGAAHRINNSVVTGTPAQIRAKALRISFSVGSGLASSNAFAVMIMP